MWGVGQCKGAPSYTSLLYFFLSSFLFLVTPKNPSLPFFCKRDVCAGAWLCAVSCVWGCPLTEQKFIIGGNWLTTIQSNLKSISWIPAFKNTSRQTVWSSAALMHNQIWKGLWNFLIPVPKKQVLIRYSVFYVALVTLIRWKSLIRRREWNCMQKLRQPKLVITFFYLNKSSHFEIRWQLKSGNTDWLVALQLQSHSLATILSCDVKR